MASPLPKKISQASRMPAKSSAGRAAGRRAARGPGRASERPQAGRAKQPRFVLRDALAAVAAAAFGAAADGFAGFVIPAALLQYHGSFEKAMMARPAIASARVTPRSISRKITLFTSTFGSTNTGALFGAVRIPAMMPAASGRT